VTLCVGEVDVDCWVFEECTDIIQLLDGRCGKMQRGPSKPVAPVDVDMAGAQRAVLLPGPGLGLVGCGVLQQALEGLQIAGVQVVMEQAHAEAPGCTTGRARRKDKYWPSVI
jgi:hypothetical protein